LPFWFKARWLTQLKPFNCSFAALQITLVGTMMAHETLKLIIGLPTLKK
jgi:hypothetical protein